MRYARLVTALGLGLAASPAYAQWPAPTLYPAICFSLETHASTVFHGAWGAAPRADFMWLGSPSWPLFDDGWRAVPAYGWWPYPASCPDEAWWAYLARDLFVSFLRDLDRGVEDARRYPVRVARPTPRPRVAYKEPPGRTERSAKPRPPGADAGEMAPPHVTPPPLPSVRPTPVASPVRPVPRTRPASPPVPLRPPRGVPIAPNHGVSTRRSGSSFGSVLSGLIHLLRPTRARRGGQSVGGGRPKATHGRPAGRPSRPSKPARRRSGGGGSGR